MKRYFLRATLIIGLALMIYFGGIRLADYIVWNYMSEMPLWLYDTIRFTLDHTGNADIREHDDLSIIAIFATIVACWITTAIVVLILYRLCVRMIKRRPEKRRQS